MPDKRKIITACGVYVTRSGKLIFIDAFDHDEAGSITQAHGYNVSGTRTRIVREWRVWSLYGKVATEEGPDWDIITSV